ncbi:MAG TPA: hypothetical protein VII43_06210, partial [Opitutaceae bacterium]
MIPRWFQLPYLRFDRSISRFRDMGAFYEKILGPALFRMDSERAHELGVDSMAFLGRFPPLCRLLEAVGRLSPASFRPV